MQELRERQRLAREAGKQVAWYYRHREEEDRRYRRPRGPFEPDGRRAQIPAKRNHPWSSRDPREGK